MKYLIIIALTATLLISACAAPRQKLSAQANVNIKTANVYYAQQNVAEALKYYNLVLEDNPDHVIALRRVSDINMYNAERNPEQALQLNKSAFEGYARVIKTTEGFSKLTEEDFADIRDMKKRKDSCWARIFKIAEDEYIAGNTREAMEIFELAATLYPDRIEPLIKLKVIHQVDLKDDAKAEEILQKIYAKDPENIVLLQELGIFYLNKIEHETALTFLNKAKVKEPRNTNNLMNISYCHFELSQYQQAMDNTMIVLSFDPKNYDALTDAKYIAYKLNDNELALSFLKQLLAIRDNDKDYQEISFLLNEMKRFEDLVTYGEKWHNYDETSKDAVQLVILAAQKLKNKTLETKYVNILKKMK
ncbi:MAG: tetratricopeptide repeat protein [Candidatus Cloacimonadaceae bacterium]|nr:tetratricopeptide repeat protein [Candidatus Cloacimonadaceae bacterium]MDP3114658.1 tetratricopeptide repeat protein [Candidatus Cloacimonadaceae bacterium]